MLDNQLIQLFISVIGAGLNNFGLAGTPVVAAYQPTQQGISTAATIYYFKIGDERRGSPSIFEEWDVDNQVKNHIETQRYDTTFQLNVLAIQDPTDVTKPTASDILNAISQILTSETAIETFAEQGVGILNILGVRNPYFSDDQDRFEASPSLDFTLTHWRSVITQVPVVSSVDLEIYGV